MCHTFISFSSSYLFYARILSLTSEKIHVIRFSGGKVNLFYVVNGLFALVLCLMVSIISIRTEIGKKLSGCS